MGTTGCTQCEAHEFSYVISWRFFDTHTHTHTGSLYLQKKFNFSGHCKHIIYFLSSGARFFFWGEVHLLGQETIHKMSAFAFTNNLSGRVIGFWETECHWRHVTVRCVWHIDMLLVEGFNKVTKRRFSFIWSRAKIMSVMDWKETPQQLTLRIPKKKKNLMWTVVQFWRRNSRAEKRIIPLRSNIIN